MPYSSEDNLSEEAPPSPTLPLPQAPPPGNGSETHLATHAQWSPAEAFELLVESVRDYAVFLVTPDGRVASWSMGVEYLLGYGEADFLTLRLADLFVPEDREVDAPAHEMKRAALMGRAADDRWHLRADGTRLWVSGVLTSLLDENNELRGFAKVMRDNTEQRLMHEERERLLQSERAARLAAETLHVQAQNAQRKAETAQRAAEAADAAKDNFIAVVTHELRSPLNVITGWTHLILSQALEADERRQGLEAIQRNARAVGRLVEDLLDVTRIREGRIQLKLEPLSMSPLIARTMEEFRPVVKEKNLGLHLDIQCAAQVNADADRLHQIVGNLLSNAMKFTPDGGDIWVSLKCEDDVARLTVRDNGQGITPEFLPNVFESFQQQQLAQAGGLGLGLSIVRSLVERHGGRVTAHSEGEGRGATFIVELPELLSPETCD